MSSFDWTVYSLKSGHLKPYIKNTVITFNPVQVSPDQFTFLLSLRKHCLDNDISLDDEKGMTVASASLNKEMSRWVKGDCKHIIDCFASGFDCEGDKIYPAVSNPRDDDIKNYVIDLLGFTFSSIEDVAEKLMKHTLCKKKNLAHANKLLSDALGEIAFNNYPIVCYVNVKIGILYFLGSKVNLTIKEKNEDGTTKIRSKKDLIIDFLRTGKKSKEEITHELYRRETNNEEKKTAELILKQIKKMGVLQSEIIDGKGVYFVKG